MKTGVNVESTLYQQPCKITCQHQHFLFCHTLKIEIVSLISHFSPLTGKKKLFAFQVREEMKICLAVLVSLLGLAAAFLGEGDPAVGKESRVWLLKPNSSLKDVRDSPLKYIYLYNI